MKTAWPEIHTTDRITYRRCRRKWNWSSPLRENLIPSDQATPEALFFGSAFHFMLQDFHGFQQYSSFEDAFGAFVLSQPTEFLPERDRLGELSDLAVGMMEHYVDWGSQFRPPETWWVKNQPMVEVPFKIRIPNKNAYFVGTFDRIARDSWGQLWIVEYKTASRIDTDKLQTDPQVNAYLWAANKLFPYEHVEGVWYQQHVKSLPRPPRLLANGQFSQDKNQKTTYKLYTTALKNQFGEIPLEYEAFLRTLLERETENGDSFIRFDMVRRNDSSREAEVWKLQAEATEMARKSTPLYPNPTRDCSWDCQFRTLCLATDDQSLDAQWLKEELFVRRDATTLSGSVDYLDAREATV